MAGEKFYGTTSTFLLSVVAFISLSVYATADDGRQCYWCGPLAEQVHRSRRAPPCDAPKAHVTSCDPGFMHCAVVATAPPYTESRYCVKIYQDECYLDFCNSTKTWKMTCPCKGDLCNGQNSDREEKAFAELIEKTQKPLKKRSKKSIDEPLALPIQTEDNDVLPADSNLPVNETKQNESLNNNEENFVTHSVESDPSTQEEKLNLITSSTSTSNSDSDKTETESEKTTARTNDDTTKCNNENTDIHTLTQTTQATLESTVKIVEVNIDEKPQSSNLVKASEKLPTAEALQESANTNDANNQHEAQTTLADEIIVTTENADISTENSTNHKNGAVKLTNSEYLIIIFVYLYFYFKSVI